MKLAEKRQKILLLSGLEVGVALVRYHYGIGKALINSVTVLTRETTEYYGLR